MAARLLPEKLKAPFRGVLHGYRPPRVSFPVTFASDATGPIVTIHDRIRVRFAEADRRNFCIHLVDHGAAVEEMASFVSIAERATTFFDIGADRAVFSAIFCAMGERRCAVAYEPSPVRFASAKALAALNGFGSRLVLRQAALGTIKGRAAGTLFLDGTMAPDSLNAEGEATEMAMTTVDDEVETLAMAPDVMKIDVEGYEFEVLKGARRLLRKRKPVLCMELHLDLLERRGISPAEVVSDLKSHGYQFRSCVGHRIDASDIADSVHAVLRFVAC